MVIFEIRSILETIRGCSLKMGFFLNIFDWRYSSYDEEDSHVDIWWCLLTGYIATIDGNMLWPIAIFPTLTWWGMISILHLFLMALGPQKLKVEKILSPSIGVVWLKIKGKMGSKADLIGLTNDYSSPTCCDRKALRFIPTAAWYSFHMEPIDWLSSFASRKYVSPIEEKWSGPSWKL